MSATLYTRGCHLLPHDDRLGTRRVAFALYLCPKEWSERDGGHLRFFGCRGDQPDAELREDYLPTFGRLAFFTVGARSFHEVCEVTSEVWRFHCFLPFLFFLPDASLGNQRLVPRARADRAAVSGAALSGAFGAGAAAAVALLCAECSVQRQRHAAPSRQEAETERRADAV